MCPAAFTAQPPGVGSLGASCDPQLFNKGSERGVLINWPLLRCLVSDLESTTDFSYLTTEIPQCRGGGLALSRTQLCEKFIAGPEHAMGQSIGMWKRRGGG